ISEPRDEVTQLVPELPTFRTEGEAAELVDHFIGAPDERLRVQRACSTRLSDATYASRLRTVMDIAFADAKHPYPEHCQVPVLAPEPISEAIVCDRERLVPFDDDWDDLGAVARRATDGSIVIEAPAQRGP